MKKLKKKHKIICAECLKPTIYSDTYCQECYEKLQVRNMRIITEQNPIGRPLRK